MTHPIHSYIENGITVNVYAEKQVKRVHWQRNDTLYASMSKAQSSITSYRKAGKA